ncbi:MAG: glucose 1-dehydrogenase [Azospirillum sp.]|nr:glucose 1-dehydrogenase [Azospirillum sp.]
MRLLDKTAIVTGAAQGIGRACAEAFAAEGARVMLADVDIAKGQAAAAAIGATAAFQPCDVGDPAAVAALVEATATAFGGIDLLVNNAGIIHTAEFLDLAEADFDRVLRVNLKGAFLVGQAVARRMAADRRAGAIINMSSVNAVMAIPNQVPYSIAKGGLNQLTKVMALALAPHGIRVNGIGPGSIATDMLKVVMTDAVARQRILARTPLGRAGEPAEIARVAVFLASADASYLTGQTLYPDGGRLALNYTVPVPE